MKEGDQSSYGGKTLESTNHQNLNTKLSSFPSVHTPSPCHRKRRIGHGGTEGGRGRTTNSSGGLPPLFICRVFERLIRPRFALCASVANPRTDRTWVAFAYFVFKIRRLVGLICSGLRLRRGLTGKLANKKVFNREIL